MKSADLVKLLNLHESTLRKYALEYAEYLSTAGAGGAGHHREYSDQDVRILKLIMDMKAERVKPENVEATLSSLQAANWDRLPALDDVAQSLVPTSANVIDLQRRTDALQRDVELWRGLYETERADRDELLRRIHEAELMLKLYQSGKLKPE